MVLLKHVAKHHCKERDEIIEEENVKSLIKKDLKDTNVEAEDMDNSDEIFVFKESK